jgi:hypothetical protein
MVALDGFRVFVNFVLLIGAAALFILISFAYVYDEKRLQAGELYG